MHAYNILQTLVLYNQFVNNSNAFCQNMLMQGCSLQASIKFKLLKLSLSISGRYVSGSSSQLYSYYRMIKIQNLKVSRDQSDSLYI